MIWWYCVSCATMIQWHTACYTCVAQRNDKYFRIMHQDERKKKWNKWVLLMVIITHQSRNKSCQIAPIGVAPPPTSLLSHQCYSHHPKYLTLLLLWTLTGPVIFFFIYFLVLKHLSAIWLNSSTCQQTFIAPPPKKKKKTHQPNDTTNLTNFQHRNNYLKKNQLKKLFHMKKHIKLIILCTEVILLDFQVYYFIWVIMFEILVLASIERKGIIAPNENAIASYPHDVKPDASLLCINIIPIMTFYLHHRSLRDAVCCFLSWFLSRSFLIIHVSWNLTASFSIRCVRSSTSSSIKEGKKISNLPSDSLSLWSY